MLLPVSAPFHCALMKPAADRLAGELDGVAVAAPRIPVVRNVDAGVTTSADEVQAVPRPPGGEPGALDRLRRCAWRARGRRPSSRSGPAACSPACSSARSTARAGTRWRTPRRSTRRSQRLRGARRMTEAKPLAGPRRDRHRRDPRHRPGDRPLAGRGRGFRGSLWPRRGPARAAVKELERTGRDGAGRRGGCGQARGRRPAGRGGPRSASGASTSSSTTRGSRATSSWSG